MTDGAGDPISQGGRALEGLAALISQRFGTPSAAPRSSLRSALVSEAIGHNDAERPGAGAAGGVGFAALALLNATIRPGIELILELIDFDSRIVGADLVVTGEGSLDDQSLAGKAPIGVARAAARSGVPVVAIAGRLRLSPQQLRQAGISAAYALTDLEPDLDRCIANASPLLRQLGATIAKEWLARLLRS